MHWQALQTSYLIKGCEVQISQSSRPVLIVINVTYQVAEAIVELPLYCCPGCPHPSKSVLAFISAVRLSFFLLHVHLSLSSRPRRGPHKVGREGPRMGSGQASRKKWYVAARCGTAWCVAARTPGRQNAIKILLLLDVRRHPWARASYG